MGLLLSHSNFDLCNSQNSCFSFIFIFETISSNFDKSSLGLNLIIPFEKSKPFLNGISNSSDIIIGIHLHSMAVYNLGVQ